MRNRERFGGVRGRFGDRLFVAVCTTAYLVLVAAVAAALRLYGG